MRIASRSPWRRPRFRILGIGWFATNLADALYLVLAIWVRELTGSEILGALVFFALGASTLLAPFIGHLADLVSRRTLLIWTNLAGAALVLTLLFVRSADDVWWIFAVTFGYGIAAVVTGAAQAGLLRDLLPDDELAAANGAMSSIDNAMRLISPPLGTALYVAFGAWSVAVLSAAGFVIMAIALLVVRVTESPAVLEDRDEPMRAQLTAGFRVLFGDPTLRLLTLVTALAFGATGLLNATVFPFVEVGMREGPWVLGPLQAVQGGGAVLGGLTAAWILTRIGERRLAAFGLAMLGLGNLVGLAMLIWTPDALWGRWAGMSTAQALIGIGVPWIIVGVVTYRQKIAPPRQQGRSSAALNAVINVPQMLLLAGGLALMGVIDFRILVGVSALGVLVAAIWTIAARLPRSGAPESAGSELEPVQGTANPQELAT